ncbi:MAG: DUF4270 family protein [Candidatus Egerieousia sp.]
MPFKSIFKSAAVSIAILALITSCITVDKTLGSANVSDDYVLQLNSATFKLPLEMKLADSLQALSQSNGYLGSVRTPEFGLANFSFGTNFCPYRVKVNFGKDQIIKNAYITFSSVSGTIADETQVGIMQRMHVYRMNRIIDEEYAYNNQLKDEDYIHTAVDSGGTYYTGTDSLTIRLKHSFAREILQASKLERDSSVKFVERYKGLLFTCDAPAEGTYGGRVNTISTSAASLVIAVNFQPTWKEGLPRKDTAFTFVLSPDYTQNFSTYESAALESTQMQEHILVEGIGGVKPYLDPLALKDAITEWTAREGLDPKRIIVGKATFYLPYENPDPLNKLSNYYPSNLFPTHRVLSSLSDDTEIRSYTPLTDIYTSNNNVGTLNRSLGYYYGDFSSYVQKIINNDREKIAASNDYKIWFMTTDAQTNQSYYTGQTSTTYSTNLGTYSVGSINGPLHDNAPYMEIVYTVLSE